MEKEMSGTLEHSKLGLTSILIGVGVWFYVLFIIFLYQYTNFLKIAFPKNDDFLLQAAEFIIFLFLYLVLPFIGFLVGLVLAIIGLVRKSKKWLFALIGLFLNILPFVITVIYNLV